MALQHGRLQWLPVQLRSLKVSATDATSLPSTLKKADPKYEPNAPTSQQGSYMRLVKRTSKISKWRAGTTVWKEFLVI